MLRVLGKQINWQIQDEGRSMDWNEISYRLDGLTGADIRSLIFSAQLEAIQEHLSEFPIILFYVSDTAAAVSIVSYS